MSKNFTSFAYTDSVKSAQQQYGSRRGNAAMEASGDRYVLSEREIPFIESRDSFFVASAGENGWPYVQHRGGPPGFLKVINETTLAMADFRGNRQYISVGNINATQHASLFLIDYPTQTRLKIWAEAKIVALDEDPELLAAVTDVEYGAFLERMMVFKVQAYDWNCPQHITRRYTLAEIELGLHLTE